MIALWASEVCDVAPRIDHGDEPVGDAERGHQRRERDDPRGGDGGEICHDHLPGQSELRDDDDDTRLNDSLSRVITYCSVWLNSSAMSSVRISPNTS